MYKQRKNCIKRLGYEDLSNTFLSSKHYQIIGLDINFNKIDKLLTQNKYGDRYEI